MENTRMKKFWIFIIALIGFVTTIELAKVYYDANFNPYALSSFCTVNEFIDCDGIARTTESQFFGIPLAYWGMFLYAFIFLMLAADKMKNFKLLKFMEVFKNPLDYIACLGILAFTISMILLCVSLFEIQKLCILCAFTYILNLLIGLIALDYKNGGLIKAVKQSVTDFLDAIKNKAYLIAFIIVMLLAGAGLTYTTVTLKFAPQVKNARMFDEFVKAKTNKYAVSGNLLGNPEGKIILYTYTDYRCPICRVNNMMIYKLAKELKNVRVEHRNLPLDTECNKYLTQPFHDGSCTMARYALAAKKQGKFWDIDNAFFQNIPANEPFDEKKMLKIAEDLGLNMEQLKKDADSIEIKQEVLKEIDEAYKQGINGTPSMKVGNNIHTGIRAYPDLKKWVIEKSEQQK